MIYEYKNIYDQLFQFLRANGLCASKADYSRCFLGRSRTYWNAINKLNKDPSSEVVGTLIIALENIIAGSKPIGERTCDMLGNFINKIKTDLALHQKEVSNGI